MMYNNIIVPQNSKGLCCIPFEFKARLAFTISCVLYRINLDMIIFLKKYFIESQPKTQIPTDSDKNARIPHLPVLGTWTAANNEPTVPTKAPHILGWGSGGWGGGVLGFTLTGALSSIIFWSTLYNISRSINPLSPNSDQHQFSPNNIHMLPREMVMRVNKMISKEKMLWSVYKLSQLIL